ncbi:undecaprenyl-diphosphate phosphatase [Alteromonas lipolytica]|uniref:Undecaprenyl-diphosphatase n=1 Tax=Alteromonas lipolytica TaxID=1856405 RepID=A0A1E8FCS3_9ALTE|nr:undecaprenyl-diphosphate phosphatase [Alteromonas lipolytica]OFI33724.1 undecaprenyl-diphosphatase [Alteromonas lipolytica]GGF69003.1 undecaprenyl-diphosphatase 1 [Alteromonas lipolytica]
MTLFEIIALAIIQGLTEFLPISSSAHLILPAAVLGWENQGLAFDVAVHVGSLMAVMIYFRQDILQMTTAFLTRGFSKNQTADSKLAWFVVVGTIPVVIAGFFLKSYIETDARSAAVIAVTTIVFGLLLWYADATAKLQKTLEQLNLRQSIIIGLAQMLAIIPGTSRSGITMTAGLMLGLNRESAARFSFLLSIPTILGAGLFATKDLLEAETAVDWSALIYGAGFSFVSAYLCIYLFLSWISRIGMLPFVIYRLLLGAVLVAFLLW